MNIKEINARKKDPAGYLEKRAFEILRELERIFAEIKPKIDNKSAEVDRFAEKTNKELQKLFSQLNTATENVNELRGTVRTWSEYAESAAKNLNQKSKNAQTELDVTLARIFSQIETKLVEIKKLTPEKGERGEPGIPGVKGKDGSPDTGEQIATKLNKTKGAVSMSVIAGLLEEIQALKREVRKKGEKGGGGGGGMGNVQYETKNLTALSTTVTTTFPISGGGYAIMGAYYQSALIMRGEHYTVGGDRKTINLLFVPEDNTKIDIIYIRG